MAVTIKGATTIRGNTTVGFSPASLFAAGEQGVWFDPSDFSTMFQDAAGTTPVTAVEQSVAVIYDKRCPVGSTSFNGSNAYLTAASPSGDLGSGDFTVEAWTFLTSRVSSFPCIWGNYSTYAAGSLAIFAGHNSGNTARYQVAINGASFPTIQSTTAIAYNTWVHIAVVRNSGVITLYINGVANGTYSTSASLGGTSNTCWIGTAGDAISTGYIAGNLSNVRVVKGTAVYTTNFTPTGPLTPVTGTSLLTCGVAWTGNPTITLNGSPAVSSSSPFGSIGNHATQSTSGNRPVLSARVNLLTKTEDFSNAAWTKLNSPTITGTNTIEDTSASAYQGVQQFFINVSGVSYTGLIRIKKTSGSPSYYPLFQVAKNGTSSWCGLIINTAAGTASVVTGALYSAPSSYSIVSSGDEWVVSMVVVATASTAAGFEFYPAASTDGTTLSVSATGSAVVSGADLRPTNQGVGLPAYQRVNTSTDYDTTGFPFYLAFDGANTTATGKFMSTGNIDFSSGNVVTAFSGFKVNTATANLIYENGQGVNSTTGFGLFANLINSANDLFIMRGTSQFERNANVSSTILTQVTSATYDIANSPYITAKSNGATLSLATNFGSNPGSGNFSTQPLYIGRRQSDQGGKLNGNIYGLIIRGAPSTSDQITATENWMNTKTRAY